MTPFQQHIVARFTALYGEPKTTDIELFLTDYAKVLDGVDGELLEATANRLIREHTYRNWPTPGECRQALNTESEQRAAARERATYRPEPVRREPTADAKARVDQLLRQCKASLAMSGPKREVPPFPRVDRDVWEARFGRSQS